MKIHRKTVKDEKMIFSSDKKETEDALIQFLRKCPQNSKQITLRKPKAEKQDLSGGSDSGSDGASASEVTDDTPNLETADPVKNGFKRCCLTLTTKVIEQSIRKVCQSFDQNVFQEVDTIKNEIASLVVTRLNDILEPTKKEVVKF